MIIKEDDYLAHYGILRKSGRYPWGSGGSQSARNRSFLDTIENHRKQGMADTEIAQAYGLSTTQLRAVRSIALNQQKQEKVNQAQKLKDKGYSNVAIGRRMGGLNESSVRALLAPGAKDKADLLKATSDMLKRQVDEKGFIDVGVHTEKDLPLGDNPNARIGISNERFKTAIAMLQEQGYQIHNVKVQQLGTVNQTTFKVLGKPNSTKPKVDQIRHINEFTEDHGRSYLGIKPPIQIDSKRIDVNWAETGGGKLDGVIYIRPGVKDISIGSAHYGQVRVAVDGTHYMKGMAIYKDDLPKGTDIVFNTSKGNTGNKKDAFKLIKDEPANPFGATIRQLQDKHGNVTSAMNIVGHKEGSGVEGGWTGWSKSISSQILSKQSPTLAKAQLKMTHEHRQAEFDKIMSLTNPTIRKHLLEKFADSTDSAAVHLKSAALPKQAYHVILPVSSMKPHEVYAPNYTNGTRVVLIRSPHGGTFEIPELTVNNRNPEARKLLGTKTQDAVGIHHKVAERLSGADFDGDTVLVIPNNRGSIRHTPPLEGLKGFDPKSAHPPYDGMTTIDGGTWNAKTKSVDYHGKEPTGRMQPEMGHISNLITDMTIRGANNEEKARAIRHSMVVIDAEKHSLDFKGSYAANGIAQLKTKYQGSAGGGAKTLISRAKSRQDVPKRTPRRASQGGHIDPATGKKVFTPTGESYVNRKGETVIKTFRSTKLAEADNAHTLSSGTVMEGIYADHSNKLKGLANQARKETLTIKPIKQSPSAKAHYANEVASLNAKLNAALKNAPLERRAQAIASTVLSTIRQSNRHMDKATEKKVKFQALAEARNRTGAAKSKIIPTQHEWNAIQAGAISNHKLEQILANGDLDAIKKLALPKEAKLMTSSNIQRAQQMLASGYSQSDVANQLGVSVTTLREGVKGDVSNG